MATHTAIVTSAKSQLNAIQVPTPTPGDGQVLLKVEYASMIAFDTYQTDLGYAVAEYPMVLGFNAAGTVVKVGEGVDDLVVGDRVTAFTYQTSQTKGMQEYTIQPRTTCAKLPASIPLDAAATIPDNFVTAFHTLFNSTNLGLPRPSSFPATEPPAKANEAILVYGAGSTAGQYAIQLLHAAGYKNIIVTASKRHHEYLHSLGATHTFDYNSSSLAEDITKAASGKVELVLDCITAETTLQAIASVVSPHGKVAILLPVKEGGNVRGSEDAQMFMELPAEKNPFPGSVQVVGVRTFLYQEDEWQKENLMPKVLPHLLATGIIQPNRVRLLDQGSFKERVATGLDLLRNNKVSGEKVIVKVTA